MTFTARLREPGEGSPRFTSDAQAWGGGTIHIPSGVTDSGYNSSTTRFRTRPVVPKLARPNGAHFSMYPGRRLIVRP